MCEVSTRFGGGGVVGCRGPSEDILRLRREKSFKVALSEPSDCLDRLESTGPIAVQSQKRRDALADAEPRGEQRGDVDVVTGLDSLGDGRELGAQQIEARGNPCEAGDAYRLSHAAEVDPSEEGQLDRSAAHLGCDRQRVGFVLQCLGVGQQSAALP